MRSPGPALALMAVALGVEAHAQELLHVVDGDVYTNVAGSGSAVQVGSLLGPSFGVQDQDGDGLADFAVVAVRGRCQGQYRIHSGATGLPITPWFCGISAYTHRSGEVGDVNGDGQRDLLIYLQGVGARLVDARTGAGLGFCDPPSHVSGYGTEWADLGDINGDGYDDVAVSSFGSGFGGTVGIHLGPDGTLLTSLDPGFGADRLASVGDIDGDGQSDLAITDFEAQRLTAVSSADWQPLYQVHPEDFVPWNGAAWGRELDAIGDLDGDGIVDLVIGEPGEDASGAGTRPGAIEFISGVDGSRIRRVEAPARRAAPVGPMGEEQNAGAFGATLSAGLDVNGDGFGDVVVGSTGRYHNSAARLGATSVVSGRTGEFLIDLRPIEGDPHDGERGFYAALVGDLDGDGLAEFAAGSSGATYAGARTGRIRIYRGFNADAVARCDPSPHSGGAKARLALEGSLSLSSNDLWLQLSSAPANTSAVFFVTPGVQTTPMGALGLCVGGAGTLRVSAAVAVDAGGLAGIASPSDTAPFTGTWMAGAAWTFQSVFRDAGSPAGFASSNAIVVRWGP